MSLKTIPDLHVLSHCNNFLCATNSFHFVKTHISLLIQIHLWRLKISCICCDEKSMCVLKHCFSKIMPFLKTFTTDLYLFSFSLARPNKRHKGKRKKIGDPSKWMLCFITAASRCAWNKETLHLFMNSIDYPVSGCAGYACGFMTPCIDTIAQ